MIPNCGKRPIYKYAVAALREVHRGKCNCKINCLANISPEIIVRSPCHAIVTFLYPLKTSENFFFIISAGTEKYQWYEMG